MKIENIFIRDSVEKDIPIKKKKKNKKKQKNIPIKLDEKIVLKRKKIATFKKE